MGLMENSNPKYTQKDLDEVRQQIRELENKFTEIDEYLQSRSNPTKDWNKLLYELFLEIRKTSTGDWTDDLYKAYSDLSEKYPEYENAIYNAHLDISGDILSEEEKTKIKGSDESDNDTW